MRERCNPLTHPRYDNPELVARAPNPVGSWDLTRLLGSKTGSAFYLYVRLDLFRRYGVGWRVAERQSAALASRLMEADRNGGQRAAGFAHWLVVEFVIKALDRREWPGTEAEIKVARAPLFAAQAIARDLIAAGRENEIEEILQFVSALVSEATKYIGEQDRRTRFASSPLPGRENSLRQPGFVQSLA